MSPKEIQRQELALMQLECQAKYYENMVQKAKERLLNLKIIYTDSITERVYVGKPGCLCGCKGVYTYKENTKEAQARGGKVNAKSVRIAVGKVMRHQHTEVVNDTIEAQIGDTLYVLFLKQKKTNSVLEKNNCRYSVKRTNNVQSVKFK